MPPTLRLAMPSDGAAIAAIYDPIVRDTVISFEAEPPGPEEMGRRVTEAASRWPWLVLEEDGMVLGYAYAKPYRERAAYQWTIESSVYVAEAGRGRGVASALYTTLFAIAHAMGHCGVVAVVTLPNAASVGLHERFGFTPVGRFEGVGHKLGGWHTVGFWQKALRPRDAAPPPLLPLGEVVGTPAWEAAIAAGLQRVEGVRHG